jgi:hypothetical protein
MSPRTSEPFLMRCGWRSMKAVCLPKTESRHGFSILCVQGMATGAQLFGLTVVCHAAPKQ